MHHEEIELATEVEEEKEETLEESKDHWYATTINNHDTMQESVHFQRQHVCIFTHQIMTQKNVLHYWEDPGKENLEQSECLVDFGRSKG
jgi:hypothetical protein